MMMTRNHMTREQREYQLSRNCMLNTLIVYRSEHFSSCDSLVDRSVTDESNDDDVSEASLDKSKCRMFHLLQSN